MESRIYYIYYYLEYWRQKETIKLYCFRYFEMLARTIKLKKNLLFNILINKLLCKKDIFVD